MATSNDVTHDTTASASPTTDEASETIRAWLLDYAWSGTNAQQEAEIACIMSQEDWRHVSARTEHLLAQRSGERPLHEDIDDAEGLALSSLYECHDGPHLPTCPHA